VLWLVVFVAGSAGGAVCDQIHVQSGVLAYPHPWLADQAWWVAPQFGAGLVAVFAAARSFVAGDPRRPGRGAVITNGAWFLGAYAASGWWHGHPVGLAIGYGVAWLARVAVRPDAGRVAVFSVLLALGGVLYEGTLAGAGGFHYAHPDFYHVPLWLPGIYLHGGPLALTVARLVGRGALPAHPVERGGGQAQAIEPG